MIFLSVTEAARGFSDLVNRIRYRRETAVLSKGGKAVARMIPMNDGVPARDLAKAWVKIPRLGYEEAAALASELQASLESLQTPGSKWD